MEIFMWHLMWHFKANNHVVLVTVQVSFYTQEKCWNQDNRRIIIMFLLG